ncbi:hypothetical protein MT1_0611 [Pseudomonas sp. MT-1]|uniref:hypothetical protein n=1 Tax=Stutzerimonas stutzeri TaxID=316 RepID=UPI000535FCB9|nr:hypothetical protein [Stutzerimonas stutzeri]MCQ4281962.1 hypothetical protein [Stutzerimonas stutzeri]BAP77787.1 hypothetical protein MT1_0611 [Pseudomonas sp. MT-1]
MDKVYRLLKWLSAEQAIDWLQELTASPITVVELGDLCNSGHCGIYVACSGEKIADEEHGIDIELAGTGKVTSQVQLDYGPFAGSPISFQSRITIKCDAYGVWGREGGVPDFHFDKTFYLGKSRVPAFKPEEILALAGKLNGTEAPKEKPLHPSERRSVGQIIATLAAMAKLDLSAPYAADEALRAGAATHGLELPSSPETVVKFLKDAAARTSKA